MSKSKNPRFNLIIICVALLLVALFFAGIYFFSTFSRGEIDYLYEPESIKNTIAAAGPWGPIIYMLMQMTQVVVAPIPGSVMGFVAGYLYGTVWATVLTMVGSTIGFYIVFVLTKKLGRPFVLRHVDAKKLKKYDKLAEDKGQLFLYIGFLLPILPDPLVGYIAGLTPLSIRRLLFIAIIARLPGVIITAYVGAQTAATNYVATIVALSVTLLIVATVYYYRVPLEKRFFPGAHKKD